jgi:hypothetical protein
MTNDQPMTNQQKEQFDVAVADAMRTLNLSRRDAETFASHALFGKPQLPAASKGGWKPKQTSAKQEAKDGREETTP